jgi:hypothetical protein
MPVRKVPQRSNRAACCDLQSQPAQRRSRTNKI